MPYLREIMDAVNDPAIQKIVVMKSAQVGYTEGVIGNTLGYFIHQDPAPVLIIQATLETAESWSKDRLAPMLRDTPALAGKVHDPKSRDSDSTIRHKAFPGGRLTIIGSNSAAGLRMRPIRIVLADEVDAWPVSAATIGRQQTGGAGDPLSLAESRQQTFWNRKTLLGSTPLHKSTSVICREYEGSDRRRFFVPCCACGHEQTLRWQQVRWDKTDDGKHKPETAHYVCEHCGAVWTEAERQDAIGKGEWRAEQPTGKTAGFHVNALLSPWLTLEDIAERFLRSKHDPETLKAFVNEVLGEPWEDPAEKLEGSGLIARGENYTPRSLPASIQLVTAGVDVQGDRLECHIAGWGAAEESWLIACEVLHGDPAQSSVWDDLDKLLLAPLRTERGHELRIAAACIDTGGHHANNVHAFCKRRRARRIFPTKGLAGVRPVWPRRASRSGVKGADQVFLLGVDTAKDAIYGRLRISKPGPGYIHFPAGQGFDEAYFAQLTSEQVVTRKREGRPYRIWVLPSGRRNEALDCAVLALAARLSIPVRLGEAAPAVEPAPAVEVTEPPPPPAHETLIENAAAVAGIRHSRLPARESSWLRGARGWWDRR